MGTFTSGKSQFFRTFANDLDDNPKYYFQPGEIEAMKANAESRAMDRAQGLGGMF
jgi:CRISPR/Cas system endoribonuclease Cas6 (RAMP superfamily)